MYPTLKPGNYVVIFKTKRIKKNDIVVARNPVTRSKIILKRVLELRGDKVFLIGDNASESTDSRDFGEVDLSEVIGKVVLVI